MHIAFRHVRIVLCAVCDGVGCLGCMSDDDLTILGEVRYGAASAPDRFGIRRADRRAHFYAQGKTQTGKSTLLENMIVQDIQNGEGVALLDPHGDIAERVLSSIPSWRTDDLCYFNASDLSYPIGLNILYQPRKVLTGATLRLRPQPPFV